eukprot:TRINITY_DN114253_c0_g1_i1.p1 TRINITY_DN114253_c0_g1~~TRINITY_DN114253_c0_g1_i1.p1  ORF type:complete len:239 (+),score=67.93 TRINITY_DN114253_c0_g1_i1:2-718(+)
MGATMCCQDSGKDAVEVAALIQQEAVAAPAAGGGGPPQAAKVEPETVPTPQFEAGSSFFVMKVALNGGSLGLDIDKTDMKVCLIKGIVPGGLVYEANIAASPDKAVRVTDRLVKVDGQGGSTTDLIARLANVQTAAKDVELVFEHPKEKYVNVEKKGRRLGLSLELNELSVGLAIKAVEDEGVIKELNQEARPEMRLVACDRIVEVEGNARSSTELLEEIKSKESFSMKVLSWDVNAQ